MKRNLLITAVTAFFVMVSSSCSSYTPISDDVIIFVSDQDGNYEIYKIFVDTSEIQNLTNEPGNDIYPVWSPDGQYIAFVSDRDHMNGDLFIMDEDGHNVRNITNTEAIVQGPPRWSPDGQYIAFISDRDHMNGDLFIINVNDSTIQNLTHDELTEFTPDWKPSGESIVFGSWNDEIQKLSTVDVETLEKHHIVSDTLALFPTYSPNGDYIAYVSLGKLSVAASDGNIRQVTDDRDFQLPPIWSPDGDLVAVSLSNELDVDVAIVNPSNLEFFIIPHENFNDYSPVWSPNGQYIATLSDRHGVADVFIMSIDSGEIRQLTQNALNLGSGTPPDMFFGQLDWRPAFLNP